MNDTDVRKQISQMVNFIKQEAGEKAKEIEVKAEEEFNIEKLRMVEADKQKIRKEYERREKQVEVQKRIAYSMEVNSSRLKVLKARDECLHEIVGDLKLQLAAIGQPTEQYKALVKNLILQGLIALMEKQVTIQVREADKYFMNEIINQAASDFKKKTGMDVKITMDDAHPLPPAPSPMNAGASCCGGVIISSANGRTKCNNTLDARLDIVFEAKLPEIRKILFGEKPPQAVVPPAKHH
mmetsp:Transcript_17617/g.30340  ORF Transcript_17617/g.30340 Transcript_17617/m.30340 type:complete len:239 (+) Transcript_17617:123-839(+)|eukprot:CAMPEP_0196656082 /NCGR_PEP_ID=MMETSP1086-20130531/13080_1 /TAXON_ID=77921 /ORGANISM="Cyanoptyche  gloeocystis , Strain SAG4.97" /LENGTH=238 /DNA_ID=CAMNT_0041988691 /DNA_START=102 /DNA_END=818 /DNA_ORIENTATION=-